MDNLEILEKASELDTLDMDNMQLPNRKARKYYEKSYKKSNKVSNDGVSLRSLYRTEKTKESYNTEEWMKRIKSSAKFGKKIKNQRDEKEFNDIADKAEARDLAYKHFLIDFYGQEDGMARYEKHMAKMNKKANKKINQ